MTPKPYVIIVDDQQSVDAVIKELDARYEHVGLTTMADALWHLEQEQVDVLVVGQELSDGDGTELLARAADISPLTCRIVMSSAAGAKFLLKAINVARVTHFIAKPVDPVVLDAAISEALVARGRSREALTNILLGKQPAKPAAGSNSSTRVRPQGWPENMVEDLKADDFERLAWFLDPALHIGVALMSPQEHDAERAPWSAELELRLVTSLRETDHCFRVGERGFLVLFGHTSRRGCRSAGRRFGTNLSGGICLQTMQWPDDSENLDPVSFAEIILSQT